MINIHKTKIEYSQERISIIVSPKNSWISLLLGIIWTCGWVFCFTFLSIRLFFHNKETVVDLLGIIWLIAWIALGLAMTLLSLWTHFRQEKFIAEKNTTSFEKTIFGIGKKQQLESSEISNIRSSRNIWINNNAGGLGNWGVKFDYKLKTFSLGLRVHRAEADEIITIMNNYFKSNPQ